MARSKKLTRWRRVGKAVLDNAGDLPHMETFGRELMTVAQETEDTVGRQSALAAGKQEESKRLLDLEVTAGKLMTFLTAGIRQRYGDRAEKLTEFGLRPLRSGRRRAVEPPAPEAAKAVEEPEGKPQS